MKPNSPLLAKRFVLLALAALPLSGNAEDLRELSTDRPDTTESPFTVDAGHFQLEMEIASWTRDGGDREYSLGELNAKFGLDACNDLQLVLPLYRHLQGGDEGFDNVQLRWKHNIWGNDGGDTALAVMPFVQFPTGNSDLGNGKFEGGIIVPFGFTGPNDWAFGVQAEGDLISSEDDSHDFAFLATATASHSLTQSIGFFVELVSILDTGSSSDWEAYFNSGLTWAINPLTQLDGGIRVGLTDASADFSPFIGISTKF